MYDCMSTDPHIPMVETCSVGPHEPTYSLETTRKEPSVSRIRLDDWNWYGCILIATDLFFHGRHHHHYRRGFDGIRM